MMEGSKTLSERIQAFECINKNMLNSYDRLTYRVSLQEGNIYSIEIMSKDEMLSLLNRLHTLESSMREIEQNPRQ